jgi:hypothetical protein
MKATEGSNEPCRRICVTPVRNEVVINESPGYDEAHRQKILLERARQFEGRRILIGLDADEALSANCLESKEWKQIEDAEPGTILRFRWVNILPGFNQIWIPPNRVSLGFVDDGSPHTGKRIHSPRVPNPTNAPILDCPCTHPSTQT